MKKYQWLFSEIWAKFYNETYFPIQNTGTWREQVSLELVECLKQKPFSISLCDLSLRNTSGTGVNSGSSGFWSLRVVCKCKNLNAYMVSCHQSKMIFRWEMWSLSLYVVLSTVVRPGVNFIACAHVTKKRESRTSHQERWRCADIYVPIKATVCQIKT